MTATEIRLAGRDAIVARRLCVLKGTQLSQVSLEEFGDEHETFRKPWCAEVLGSADDGKWVVDFLPFKRDFIASNGVGTRGVKRHYTLRDGGIYVVKEQLSWRRSERRFVAAHEGRAVNLSTEDVIGCLESEV